MPNMDGTKIIFRRTPESAAMVAKPSQRRAVTIGKPTADIREFLD